MSACHGRETYTTFCSNESNNERPTKSHRRPDRSPDYLRVNQLRVSQHLLGRMWLQKLIKTYNMTTRVSSPDPAVVHQLIILGMYSKERSYQLIRSSLEHHLTKHAWIFADMQPDLVSDHDTPKTYEEAVSGPDAEQWKKAIHEELTSLKNCAV